VLNFVGAVPSSLYAASSEPTGHLVTSCGRDDKNDEESKNQPLIRFVSSASASEPPSLRPRLKKKLVSGSLRAFPGASTSQLQLPSLAMGEANSTSAYSFSSGSYRFSEWC
jgi:hypothetical protein